MRRKDELIDAVTRVYEWIDLRPVEKSKPCKACGKCCDFDSFDHRLFITGPELIYFQAGLKGRKLRPMTAGKCPYNVGGKCGAYSHRFAGCRIFSCTGDTDSQSKITESAVKKFKAICERFDIAYRYIDLSTALNQPEQSINSSP